MENKELVVVVKHENVLHNKIFNFVKGAFLVYCTAMIVGLLIKSKAKLTIDTGNVAEEIPEESDKKKGE